MVNACENDQRVAQEMREEIAQQKLKNYDRLQEWPKNYDSLF